jgi:hypothetical protein
MCKVIISNRGNSYCNFNTPSKEFDIPSEMVPVLQGIFNELNATRKTATEPIINLNLCK